jgi:hypothetical protein
MFYFLVLDSACKPLTTTEIFGRKRKKKKIYVGKMVDVLDR